MLAACGMKGDRSGDTAASSFTVRSGEPHNDIGQDQVLADVVSWLDARRQSGT